MQITLAPGHRRAKLLTNCVSDRFGDGPDTPARVRGRIARAGDREAEFVDRLDDETIDLAIRGVRELERRWLELPPGATLRLAWPLRRDVFA